MSTSLKSIIVYHIDLPTFCNHLAEEERAGCFILIAFLIFPCLLLTVVWVGLQSVLVGFPGHTYLLCHAYALL